MSDQYLVNYSTTYIQHADDAHHRQRTHAQADRHQPQQMAVRRQLVSAVLTGPPAASPRAAGGVHHRTGNNDLPMAVTIAALGREGPPAKMSEGYVRFLCPRCHEMHATVNPRNNLAHCFCCQQNTNNIDLLITLGYDFRAAVTLLERWLRQYETQRPQAKAPTPSPTA